MKRLLPVIALLLFACTNSLMAQSKGATLKDIVNNSYSPRTAPSMKSMNDGEHYTRAEAGNSKIVKYSYKTGAAVETIFDATEARECPFTKFDDYEFSNDEGRILIWCDSKRNYRRSFKANYYVFDRRRNYVYTVSQGGLQQGAQLSPDGRMVAFARDNNMHLYKLDFDTESEMTQDGEQGKIINGTPDWLYEEEFGVTRSFVWSPDNSCVAFIRTDEGDVPTFDFQLFGGSSPTREEYRTYPGTESFKYPKAGMTNPKVSVQVYYVASKKVLKMNIPIEEEGYIPRLFFTEDPNQLVVMTLNRIQSVLNLFYVNPRSAVSRLILRDESPYYIDEANLDMIKFYKECFVMVSEKDGFKHIYQHGRSGALMKQVTIGQWDVTQFLGYDEATKAFYYQSSEDAATQRAVFCIDAKGKKSRITPLKGTNSTTFSSKFKYYTNTYSNYTTPPTTTLYENNGRKVVRVLEDNSVLKAKLKEITYNQREPLYIPIDGEEDLNGWIIKPKNSAAGKKLPVVMVQYSGPGSQSALDRWSLNWENYMADNGFIVVCVDGRGTGARGEKFKKSNYMALGGVETDDQIAAAQYLAKQPYVDGKRIGIWGWSYGGYNVLMAMSKGEGIFKAGTAIAPVTDWRYYDTAYTERFMRTPQENFEGYSNASPILWADKLQGHLLLVHGTADDNVHYQNTLEYADALVEANKQFEMQIYTNKDHSIRGGNARMHLYTLLTNFFKRSL